jgi:hypothetical protein
MTQVKTPTASTEVRSFRIEVPEEDLLHLRQRILATRWPVAKALASNVLGAGDPPPSGLSADEQRAYDRLSFLYTKGIGYALEMGLRPQTLYGLADSPVALAAWMLDHDTYSYEDIARAFAGDPVGNLTQDEVLDNITLTWVTNTGVSSGRLYWENNPRILRRQGRHRPGSGERLPSRALSGPAELDRAGQSQPHLLQRSRYGQPLRRLARAGPLHHRGASRIQVPAPERQVVMSSTVDSAIEIRPFHVEIPMRL